MIIHEEDYDRANIILNIDNQHALQALFDYIIYLCIQFYHNILTSNRIHTDSGMLTISTYLLNLFKHSVTSWLGKTPHFIINNIDELKSIDQCYTQEYHDYQDAIKQIFSVVELSSSFMLLKLLITHHIFENEILLLIGRY
ncbi:unnamed protein product [Adineta steineri]|uniref:Uncharacterized protein n=1 Tax=Adineta steineri TaxID=433720 RepID=A0A818PT86_9BILA|nr:unnamed protein product [Adineta steineri]CAF3624290.1 unnamed protein product [Adineta steineri]